MVVLHSMRLPNPEELSNPDQLTLWRYDSVEYFAPDCSSRSVLYHRQLDLNLRLATALSRNGWLLDVGCAQGNVTTLLAHGGVNSVGIDIRRSFLEYARVKDGHGAADFIASNAYKLPVRSSSIGCIVANQLFEHLADLERLMSEFGRVLERGGNLLIATPNHDAILQKLPNYREFKSGGVRRGNVIAECGPDGKDHLFLFTMAELEEFLELFGFEIIESRMHSNLVFNWCSCRMIPRHWRPRFLLLLDKVLGMNERTKRLLMRQILIHARKL